MVGPPINLDQLHVLWDSGWRPQDQPDDVEKRLDYHAMLKLVSSAPALCFYYRGSEQHKERAAELAERDGVKVTLDLFSLNITIEDIGMVLDLAEKYRARDTYPLVERLSKRRKSGYNAYGLMFYLAGINHPQQVLALINNGQLSRSAKTTIANIASRIEDTLVDMLALSQAPSFPERFLPNLERLGGLAYSYGNDRGTYAHIVGEVKRMSADARGSG